MFAKPNGSGKSPIYAQIKDSFDTGIYLNADELEKELKTSEYIELNRFGLHNIIPKVLLLEKAQKLGYRNYLYFVSTESDKINLERVVLKVKLGGHPVEKEKIQKRYYDSLNLLKQAVELSYRSFIFDNSGKKPILILEVLDGNEITYHNTKIPYWIDKYLLY